MAANKTVETDADVREFIESVADDAKRADCRTLVDMMARITGEPPKMWGASIVGFGSYHYRNASGREGDFFLTGFSPRARNLTIYIMPGFDGEKERLAQLGKHKTGKSCLYVNRLVDVDESVLEAMIADSVAWMRETYKS